MNATFHLENRKSLYSNVSEASLIVFFSGQPVRKSADEDYPFFTNRNFLYLTGVDQKNCILLAQVQEGETEETMFISPSNPLVERMSGRLLTGQEVQDLSGISSIEPDSSFIPSLDRSLNSGCIKNIYLDFDKFRPEEPDNDAFRLASYIKKRYPFIQLKDSHGILKRLRTFKKTCEIEAMRKAQLITKAGIEAMMKASRPGMYEYQYKAEWDYTLAQHGVLTPAFPSIVSAGNNNFCIHYYSYRGQAQDGDMILNDVGACWDNECNDVSRGWPCNGVFSERQRLLYECAYDTSNYMFNLLKPGMPMKSVDKTIRRYNFERLKDIGLCDSYDEVGKYMWHGGAHHVGYDVHDVVDNTLDLAPGMVFCVDVGIYNEEWGIGFRLEDNCLITETGCENLSIHTPRSIEDIEAFMGKR